MLFGIAENTNTDIAGLCIVMSSCRSTITPFWVAFSAQTCCVTSSVTTINVVHLCRTTSECLSTGNTFCLRSTERFPLLDTGSESFVAFLLLLLLEFLLILLECLFYRTIDTFMAVLLTQGTPAVRIYDPTSLTCNHASLVSCTFDYGYLGWCRRCGGGCLC